MRSTAQGLIVIALLVGAVIALQAVHERNGGPPAATSAHILYVRSPEAMKRLSLSYDALLADAYWIRAIQHYGGTKLSTDPDKQYDLLYPLLDLTTSLDPLFNTAYYFGSIFLAEPFPGGPGRPDLAIALLQKGLQAQPTKWELAQAIGFVHYWWLEDYEEAAAWFKKAAAFPGAPIWLAPLAATTLAQGGNRESSRMLWQQFERTAEDEWFRGEARRRLQQLDALDQLDRLAAVVDAFRERYGRTPTAWEELRQAGYLTRMPIDPAGAPYRLEAGVFLLDPRSPLNPLPTGPARLR
jgi:tetratricopeptide (TPR) repeat protein